MNVALEPNPVAKANSTKSTRWCGRTGPKLPILSWRETNLVDDRSPKTEFTW